MAIIRFLNNQNKTINSLYPKREIGIIDTYDQSTKSITLEYFTIINKIINHYTKHNNESTKEKKKSEIIITETISSTLRGLDLNFKSEPYKEKSFFEKVSFFLSITKDAIRTSKIDNVVEHFNALKEMLNKLNELKKKIAYSNDIKVSKEEISYENDLNEFFKKYPEYKQAKDEFDRLKSEKTQKIEQMNNLVLELNNFRQYILDEFNPIVLELLDLLEENELNFKKEYMEISEKLYQKINYSFKSTSLKEIIKSEKLLKWDELKNCIEILEKDNILLDNEIDTIIGNEFFKNYINNELKDFNTVKSKLNSLIKQNEIIITKLPKIQKDIELEKLKKELKSLESKLQELVEQKIEYLNDIEEFNCEYNLHLGEIIKNILNLKKEILYKKTIKQQKKKEKYQEDIQTFQNTKETIDELKSTISELEDALDSIDEDDENYKELSEAYKELKEELEKLEDELELQEEELEKTKEFIEDEAIEQEYEEVKSHYEEFENEYKHTKESFENSIQLNEDDKKELKLLYKKAARLCHPDIVPDELKEKAHDLMQKLNDAYSKKDISKVKEILHSLKNGTSFEVSSDTIDNRELLKEKIKEYKQSIKDIEKEIEEIKEDVTYQTILEIDDWDEYFKNLKDELQNEKEILENEAREILKEKPEIEKKVKDDDIPEWMQILWDWADEYNISSEKLSRKKERLLNIKILDFTNIKLNYLPKEITNLKHLQELILWGCDLKYLPIDIIKFDKLKKLNLRGNPDLVALENQLQWIEQLNNKITVFQDNISYIQYEDLVKLEKNIQSSESDFYTQEELCDIVYKYILKNIGKINDNKSLLRISDEAKKVASQLNSNHTSDINLKYILTVSGKKNFIQNNITFETLNIQNNRNNSKKHVEKEIQKIKTITTESSSYSKHIHAIENIRFERIRKYCENLSKSNEADEMQEYLGEKGRMFKAFMYSTLEVFIEKLNGETITLCDWGCSQGIASMLVLDYIKEKQLDIKVSDAILIDDDTKALGRAMIQVEALAQNTINFIPLKSDDNNISDTIKSNKNNIVLNLFANDKIPTSFWTIDYDILDESYFLCVSNENKELVDKIYENINTFIDVQDLSILDGKIGRYNKYERIFKA